MALNGQHEQRPDARSAQLPLPKTFDGTADSWGKWRTRFERYRLCTGLANKPETVQVSTFLYCMGEVADDLLVTMDVDEKQITFDELLDMFDRHYNARKNTITARAKFNRRSQQAGEQIDHFIQDLYRLADECAYGMLKDELIRDRIVVGVRDDNLSDKLQSLSDLSITDAITISRQAEARAEEQVILRGKQQLDSLRYHRPNPKPNKPQPTKHHHPSHHPSRSHGPTGKTCPNCGKEPHKKQDCPARGQKCHRCGKIGHYQAVCRSTSCRYTAVHEVEGEYSGQEEGYLLDTLVLDSVDSECWSAEILVNGRPTTFKLDTGAAVTAVGKDVVGNVKLQPASRALRGPGDTPIRVLGCVDARLCHKEHSVNETLYVIENQRLPLLSRQACEALQLVMRVETLQLQDMKKEYPGLFRGLGKMKATCDISLKEDAKPVCLYTARNIPHPLRNKVKEELERMQADGVISPITEPTDWCSGLVVVPKPDGAVRLCIDLTNLNKAVRREVYPVSSVDESLAKLANSKVFTKLDAKSGYWQIPLSETSRRYTTFVTPFGRFCMNRLPFGICSASEIFQRTMSDILRDIDGVICHMDDILIHAPDTGTHDRIVQEVLNRLLASGVTLNEKKCEFSQKSVKFLGHIIDTDGVRPDPVKVEAITKFPPPENITELQRFFGMINHVAKFVPGLAHKNEPLRQLLRKDTAWTWEAPQQKAFQELKDLLSSASVLAHYSPERKTTVAADASSVGIGAVLLQEQNDGSRRPISYISRSLTTAEKNYATIEKEALAATWAVERFTDYLLGLNFVIETDHKPLVPLLNSKEIVKMPPRIQRFRLRLMRFNPTVTHVPGHHQVTADTLSRAPVGKPDTADINFVDDIAAMAKHTIEVLPASSRKIQEISSAQKMDEVLHQVRDFCVYGWPTYMPDNPLLQQYWQQREHLTLVEDLLLFDDRLVIPGTMRLEILTRLHEGHLGITKCRALAQSSVWWPSLSSAIEEMVAKCTTCAKHRPDKKEPLLPSSFPSRPWERLGMDLFELRGEVYLLAVDYYSRWVEVKRLTSQTSAMVIHKIKDIFSIHGIPEVVVSDNGPQFSSSEFAKFAAAYGFIHVTSSPKFPQSNGEAERAVQTVKNILKKSKDPYLALLMYRAAPLQNGCSPGQMLMGRRLNTRVPTLPNSLLPSTPDHDSIQAKETDYKQRQRSNYDRRYAVRQAPELQPGDPVHIRDLNRPGQVLQRHTSPRSYWVQTNQGVVRRNNRHLITPATPPVTPRRLPEYRASPEKRQQSPVQIRVLPVTPSPEAVHTNSHTTTNTNTTPHLIPTQKYTRSGRIIKKPTVLNL